MDNAAFKKKYGPWAMVTGASAGIGREFARQLAERGLNVVLVARRAAPLQEYARELATRCRVQTLAIPADLARDDALAALEAQLADHEIGMVINNAGTYTAGSVLKSSFEEIDRTARLNALTPLRIAHFFGRRMIDRGRGGILFVASNSGFQAVPYLGTYSASKAFVLMLGESMYAETQGTGVDVLVLAPGPTKTPGMEQLEGIDFSKIPMSFMETSKVVGIGLRELGRRQSVVTGFGNRAMIFFGQHILGRRLWLAMTKLTMRGAVAPERR